MDVRTACPQTALARLCVLHVCAQKLWCFKPRAARQSLRHKIIKVEISCSKHPPPPPPRAFHLLGPHPPLNVLLALLPPSAVTFFHS